MMAKTTFLGSFQRRTAEPLYGPVDSRSVFVAFWCSCAARTRLQHTAGHHHVTLFDRRLLVVDGPTAIFRLLPNEPVGHPDQGRVIVAFIMAQSQAAQGCLHTGVNGTAAPSSQVAAGTLDSDQVIGQLISLRLIDVIAVRPADAR